MPAGADSGDRVFSSHGKGRQTTMAVVPKFKVIEGWEKLPKGYVHKDVDGVATDSKDNVYLMTRQDARVIVYDRDGNFLRSWGEGLFTPRTHGIAIDSADFVYTVDDGDHTVRKFTPEGKQVMMIGTPGNVLGYRVRREDDREHQEGRPSVQPPDRRRRRPGRGVVRLRWVRQCPRPPVQGRRDADPVLGRARDWSRPVPSAARHRGVPGQSRLRDGSRE